MVFPLSLNAVEHYMLADDSADYPRCFVFVLRMRKSLDKARLQKAIDAATKRHPLLRALIEYNGDFSQRWIECAEPRYSIEWIADRTSPSGDDKRPIAPFDLRREPGLRFRVQRDETGDSLRIEFHHACTDGLGAVRFVGDLLALYAANANATAADLPALDPSRLATRDSFGLTGWRRVVRWLYGSIGWLAALEFLMHRPAALGNPPATWTTAAGGTSGFCAHTLTGGQTSAVVHFARRECVTVNDLLMRDMFVTIQEMIERHWPQRTSAHKRIMVPTNLRTSDDNRLPAANVVAMINLDRRPHRWSDARRLLRVLHWELALVKRLRLGVIFVQILHMLQTLFGSLRRFLPADRCQATCVVSNLGPVFTSLESELIRTVEFYPPIRSLTSAAFGVLTFQGRMTVSLHYDAAALMSDQGAELLERFMQKLRSYEMAEAELIAAPVGGDPESTEVRAGLLRSRS
jgi:Condensation domain